MRRIQILTSADALVAKRQHTAPCRDCPWTRRSVPGWIGPNSIKTWIACAHSDQRINCHTRKSAGEEFWQCAGAAIYRANICKSPRDKTVLELLPNKALVFSWGEFERHHGAALERMGIGADQSLEDA